MKSTIGNKQNYYELHQNLHILVLWLIMLNMRNLKTFINRKIILGLLSFMFMLFSVGAQESKVVDVMFMHDVHSFLDRIAQAATLINEQKAKNPDTLILDAGDFSQGTLYQAVFSTEAAEIS